MRQHVCEALESEAIITDQGIEDNAQPSVITTVRIPVCKDLNYLPGVGNYKYSVHSAHSGILSPPKTRQTPSTKRHKNLSAKAGIKPKLSLRFSTFTSIAYLCTINWARDNFASQNAL